MRVSLVSAERLDYGRGGKLSVVMFVRILIVLLLGGAVAEARLGETREECEKRYGEALYESKGGANMMFKEGNSVVIATFGKTGVVVTIGYQAHSEFGMVAAMAKILEGKSYQCGGQFFNEYWKASAIGADD